MSKKRIFLYSTLALFLFLGWILSPSNKKNEDFSEIVKIALREVGNQVLLSNQDSTSLVLPIIEVKKYTYRLSFQKEIGFEPSFIVSAIKNNFQKTVLPEFYRTEVIQCSDGEVAYSYQMTAEEESTIIPCAGRILPNNCYDIEVKFTKMATTNLFGQLFLGALIVVLFLFLLNYYFSKNTPIDLPIKMNDEHVSLGCFQFYPSQNKLVKQASEISLSRKECELLSIFIANPNQIIKREELTKKVWEDHGVFVGRSLDTYISKLRKKLIEDDSIKLINIHGVGYKLEINS